MSPIPTTTSGIVYPASTGNVDIWEHFQNMADSLETLIAAVRNPPRAKIRATANQSITTAVFTQILMDTTEFDTDGMADLVNDRLVVVTAGTYLVIGQVAWAADATGHRDLLLYAGAAGAPTQFTSDYRPPVNGQVTAQTVAGLIQCSVGDVLLIKAAHTNGTTLNAVTTNTSLTLAAYRVGS